MENKILLQQFRWLKTCLLPFKLSRTLAYYSQNKEITDFKNSLDKRKRPELNAYEKMTEIENGIIRKLLSEIKINGQADKERIYGAERGDEVNVDNFLVKMLVL